MATVISQLEQRHGVAVHPADVLELDHPWSEPGPYTFSETWPSLPEKFYCELVEGHIVMSPAALYDHQYLSGLLYQILSQIADANDADAMQAPLDVVFDDQDVLQPDLIYVAHERWSQVIKGVLHGAPNLVVEIISPSHPGRDRKRKFKLYEKYLVPEYWIFDPREQTQEFYVLVNGEYQAVTLDSAMYRSPILPVLTLDVVKLWKKYLKRFPNS